jgi:integrase
MNSNHQKESNGFDIQSLILGSPIGQKVQSFLDSKSKDVSESTLRLYEWAMKHFLMAYNKFINKPLEQIDVRNDFEAVRSCIWKRVKEKKLDKDLRKGEPSYRYIMGRVKQFLLFWGFSKEEVNIACGKKTYTDPPNPSPLTENEIKVIFRTIETANKTDENNREVNVFNVKREKCLIALGYYSGLRASEVLKLKIGQVDFDKNKGKVSGKGRERKEDVFFIFPDGVKIIKEFLEDRINSKEEYLFPEFVDGNGKVKYDRFNYIINQISKLSGVAFTFHRLRHSIATSMDGKFSPREIQEFLRHKQLSTTTRYIDVGSEELAEKIRRVDLDANR